MMSPSKSGLVVTIDGPAGSGKSTTARLLAERLKFDYIDTGAMYRAAAWQADQMQTDLSDDSAVIEMLDSLELRIETDHGRTRIFQGATELTEAIRTPEIDRLVTPVAAHPMIRERMAAWQRERAKKGRVVLEGRDTGTVVCPDADVKIYLDADLATRAKRRMGERPKSDAPDAVEAEARELKRRDDADSQREHSPLRRADDAVTVDTTSMTIDEQVEAVYQICLARSAATE